MTSTRQPPKTVLELTPEVLERLAAAKSKRQVQDALDAAAREGRIAEKLRRSRESLVRAERFLRELAGRESRRKDRAAEGHGNARGRKRAPSDHDEVRMKNRREQKGFQGLLGRGASFAEVDKLSIPYFEKPGAEWTDEEVDDFFEALYHPPLTRELVLRTCVRQWVTFEDAEAARDLGAAAALDRRL